MRGNDPLSTIVRFALMACTVPMTAATYHVDAVSGSDANTGLSAAESWKTLEAVSRIELGAGDGVLFHAGADVAGEH